VPTILFLLMWTVSLAASFPAQAFDKQPELKIPNDINPGLQHFLDLADPAKNVTFDPRMVAPVLDFVETAKNTDAIYYADIIGGLTSAYYDFDIKKNFKTMVNYAFNPDIPGVATTPSSVRLFKWIDSGEGQKTHPRVGRYLENIQSPVIFKGRQYIEITPDLTSGAYYGYNLHQIMLLFSYRQRNVVVTVSKQVDVSNVGKKGYVLGSDGDWDYFYSGDTGTTLPALGWVRSYMYDSRGINIYDDIDPAAPRVRCAVFKWLRAGWSGINMVQKKHIYRGLKRFGATYKEIIESPLLPPVDKLAGDFARIHELSQDVLRSKMEVYSKVLKNRYNSARQRSKKWPAKLIGNKQLWHRMSKEEMESAIIVEYMKYALGKTRSDEVRELLSLTPDT
jgi:hypothetical protein